MISRANPKRDPEEFSASSYVLVLNWNGWRDTIECLESVFRLNGPGVCVVVCDNASTDGSLERLKQWARGGLQSTGVNEDLAHLSNPAVTKPIAYRELTRDEAEAVGARDSAPLVLIQNGANLGFAGGNNVGLRYALRDKTAQFFWLLNNDTVVEPNALTALVQFMQLHPRVGICGSLNLSYFAPREILVRGGGTYNFWTGRVSKLRNPMERDMGQSQPRLDFINGASMLVSRALLSQVGLMEESYFLYFEEQDWAVRAKELFDLGYARDSIIYHKVGRSIGTHRNREMRSLLSERYLSRNRVIFARRFFPWTVPSVMVTLTATAAYWLVRGKVQRAWVMLSSMCEGLIGNATAATAVKGR